VKTKVKNKELKVMSATTKKVYNMFERRQAIPVIYVRGTHYDVGYDVVRK
jgi:hypothetical protein